MNAVMDLCIYPVGEFSDVVTDTGKHSVVDPATVGEFGREG